MITISAGHYGKGTGAVGLMDEGLEAIEVVEQLAFRLMKLGVVVQKVIDKQSKSKQQNLKYIIETHNKTARQLDISIHFNAAQMTTNEGIGTEVLYVNPSLIPDAKRLSAAIATAGNFKNRGAKRRTDLAFLNGTTKPALLIEMCFVNSTEDVAHYKKHKQVILDAIAVELASTVQPNDKPSLAFSHQALQQKVEVLFLNKEAVRAQLKAGIAINCYDKKWLEMFEMGSLSLTDYLALTTLQYNEK